MPRPPSRPRSLLRRRTARTGRRAPARRAGLGRVGTYGASSVARLTPSTSHVPYFFRRFGFSADFLHSPVSQPKRDIWLKSKFLLTSTLCWGLELEPLCFIVIAKTKTLQSSQTRFYGRSDYPLAHVGVMLLRQIRHRPFKPSKSSFPRCDLAPDSCASAGAPWRPDSRGGRASPVPGTAA